MLRGPCYRSTQGGNMSGRPFRFIHASDLHLDRSPHGTAEIPDSLREVLVDAPYRAAQRIFELAIHEQVDFVVLAGDVLSPAEAGPRGWAFLVEQFQRLAERQISVYWAGGEVDPPDAWPAAIDLPANVHVFSGEQPEMVTHERDEEPLCHVLGVSSLPSGRIRAGDFVPPRDGLFALGVVHGRGDADQLARQDIAYWALGGSHDRETLPITSTVAQYCGTPQGRSPDEVGAHHCVIVQVDYACRARSTFFPTDAVRFLSEPLHLPESAQTDKAQRELAHREELQRMLASRAQSLLANHAGPDLLVSWAIRAPEAVAAQLRSGTLATDLLSRLRSDFTVRRPGLWSISLVAARDEATIERMPAELFEQETILGEFMRTVRAWDRDSLTSLDLEPLVGQRHADDEIGAAVKLADVAVRKSVLGEVALLGVDLLSPEESRT